MADTTAATGSTVDWGALLGQILTGGLGVAGAVNGGSLSATGNAATAAAAADPFSSQRGQYQTQLAGTLGQQQNPYGQQFNQAYAGQQNPSLGTFQTAQANQQNPYATQLNQLLTDPNSFKTDPGYQFALSQGQDAARAQGNALYGGQRAGALAPELAKYTEGYAAQAYDTRLNQLGTLSGQQNSYNLGNLGALNQNAQVQGGINANNLGALAGMFGQQGTQNNQSIQNLLVASGAETGSPATSGSIIGGGFQTQNSDIANIIKALTGSNTGASTPGILNLIKGLGGNSGGTPGINTTGAGLAPTSGTITDPSTNLGNVDTGYPIDPNQGIGSITDPTTNLGNVDASFPTDTSSTIGNFDWNTVFGLG